MDCFVNFSVLVCVVSLKLFNDFMCLAWIIILNVGLGLLWLIKIFGAFLFVKLFVKRAFFDWCVG